MKKTYLKSGLYSSDLKVNPDENSSKNGRTLGASRAIVSSRQRAKAESAAAAANNNSFFELPINYGSVLMSRQKDFTLPFDIMQAWQQGLLRKTVQPEPFIKIRSSTSFVSCCIPFAIKCEVLAELDTDIATFCFPIRHLCGA